ncbi:MAG: hypothetical protein NVSMB7_06460 [Chitinophagaceae bacterium]
MKKVILFACVLLVTGSSFANTPKISEKALKAFKATFKDAENVVWTDAENVYTVKFSQQGINTFVKYDEEGNFISSRRYYAGVHLPVDIQCKLKKKFADKTIFGVTEYTIGDDVNYYVKMEDAKNWVTVKIDNARNTEVTEEYQKL